MKVLFIHQNFPGQFRHVAAHLAQRPEVEVLAIGRDSAPGLPGVRLLLYLKAKGYRPDVIVAHPGWGGCALRPRVSPGF